MLIFPQNIKCTHILTFFFRINSFLANQQKGRGSHLKKEWGGLYYTWKRPLPKGLEVITALFLWRKGNNFNSGKVACWQGSQSHGSPKEVKRLVFKVIVQWKVKLMFTWIKLSSVILSGLSKYSGEMQKSRVVNFLSMLQASKCQVRLLAERANSLKYNEKVHIGYLII